MSKIFSAVSKRRLSFWADLNNKLSLGSEKAEDGWPSLINMYAAVRSFKRKQQPIYVCFVDFAEAFDTENHNLLWKKLCYLRVSMKLLTILQNMYSKATARVIGNKLSEPVHCNKGVRHGCNLSPLLFNLFISDLETHLTSHF